MKLKGETDLFHYRSSYWTDKNVYAQDSTNMQPVNAKFKSYFSAPITHLLLFMERDGDLRHLTVAKTANSLRDILIGPTNQQFEELPTGKTGWKNLVGPSAALQPMDCPNMEGFNIELVYKNYEFIFHTVRIGIAGDESQYCDTPNR